jgi:hypothetical protein
VSPDLNVVVVYFDELDQHGEEVIGYLSGRGDDIIYVWTDVEGWGQLADLPSGDYMFYLSPELMPEIAPFLRELSPDRQMVELPIWLYRGVSFYAYRLRMP